MQKTQTIQAPISCKLPQRGSV